MFKKIAGYTLGLYAVTIFASLIRVGVKSLIANALSKEAFGIYGFYSSAVSVGISLLALGLARALALNPKILFLDEPTAGLDPIRSTEIDELVLRINATANTTMVIVTHELDSIFNIANRVIMIDKDKKGIIADGDPKDLRDHSPDPVVRRFLNRGEA